MNVYVEHIGYFHKPRADGWMMHVCIILSLRLMFFVYYLNFFCKPGSDVEPETEDTCLIVSLGLFFISLGLKLTYFALREPRFNGGECICWAYELFS